MRKVILLSLAAIMLLSGTVMATESRIQALGGYTAPYICDDANIYKWYATLPSYSNLVLMTMWNDGDYEGTPDGAFAMTYALGEEGKYGTLGMGFMESWHHDGSFELVEKIYTKGWVDNDYDFWEDHDAPNSDYWGKFHSELGDIEGLESRYIIGYGYQMEKMSFGLFFNRESVKYKYTYEGTEIEDYDVYERELEGTGAATTFGLGFRMDLTDVMTIDLAGDYTKLTDTWTDFENDDGEEDKDEYELDPGKIMSFRGRMFYEWNDEITFVPYASYTGRDFAYKKPADEEYDDVGFGYKDMEMTFGIGANMTVNEDAMILFAVEPFSYWKAEPSGYAEEYVPSWEIKYLVMPRFILALESDLTDWLTFRTGCSKDLGKVSWKWEDDNETEEEEWTFDLDSFAWNLGLGFHFGDFDIDCVINKSVPFRMGYWLTGMQDKDDIEVNINGPSGPEVLGAGYGSDLDGSDTPIAMISAKYHF